MGEELWVKTLCPQEVHTSYRKQSTWKRWEGALPLSLIHHLSDSNAELNKHPGSITFWVGTGAQATTPPQGKDIPLCALSWEGAVT